VNGIAVAIRRLGMVLLAAPQMILMAMVQTQAVIKQHKA
jgi:hypothetical protein